jgi:hypothetical protein
MNRVYKNNCICEVCKKEFHPRKKNSRTCSKKCCDSRYNILHKEDAKIYRLKNKEIFKKKRSEHYQKNIEKERALCKKWYDAHKESEKEKNREYRKQNKELFDWYHDKDRFGGIKTEVLKRDNNRCRACGSIHRISVHHKDVTGDHKHTKIIKTNNDIKNLITLCGSCHTRLHRWQTRNNTILLQDEDIVRTCRRLQEANGKS